MEAKRQRNRGGREVIRISQTELLQTLQDLQADNINVIKIYRDGDFYNIITEDNDATEDN